MDLNRLIKDLKEIRGCIEDDPEQAEDLLDFVIGEIAIHASLDVFETVMCDGGTPGA